MWERRTQEVPPIRHGRKARWTDRAPPKVSRCWSSYQAAILNSACAFSSAAGWRHDESVCIRPVAPLEKIAGLQADRKKYNTMEAEVEGEKRLLSRRARIAVFAPATAPHIDSQALDLLI